MDADRDRSIVSIERIGGIAALLVALGYIVVMPLFAVVGTPPEGAVARLEYHAAGTDAWWGIVALSVVTDLLLVPVAVALVAMARTERPAMLLGALFIVLFVVLDLAVLWPAKVSLLALGEGYTSATPDGRALLVAAAAYPSAVLDSDLVAIYSVLTIGIGILLTGLAMWWERLGRATAIAGIATGAVAVASVIETTVTGGFSVLVVIASLLTIAWLAPVGAQLARARPGPSI